MKIKKIEIEAFRAYDEMDEGTFDFELRSNEIANFVSIYAPNGFGKTSFYDAIEWSYTNRISRLDKSHLLSKVAKSERDEINIGGRQEQYILKNKNSSKEQGTVNLYIDKNSKILSRKTPKIGKGQSDYKFNKQILEKGTEPFQEVILSQEWIDAFLREDNPQIRYEKFISAFGEEGIENQYKTIRELIKKNNKEIENINGDLKELKAILDEKLDDQLLDNINKAIKHYNELGGLIAIVDINMTDSQFVKFSDVITDERKLILDKIASIHEKLNGIKGIEYGTESLIGIKGYFKKKEELLELTERESLLKQIKIHIKDLVEHKNQDVNYSKKVEESEKLKENLQYLKSKYSKYDRIRTNIASERISVEENNKKVEELKKLLENKEREIEKAILLKENKGSTLQKDSQILKKIPSVIKVVESLTNNREDKNKKLLKLNDDIRKNKDEESKLHVDIKGLSLILDNLSDQNFSSLPTKYIEVNSKQLKNLNYLLIDIKGVKVEIAKVSEQIVDTKTFKKELSDFVKKGYDIVNNRKMTTCPLCEHDYFEFENLSEKISQNSLIDESLQKKLKEKEELHRTTQALQSAFDIEVNSLINPVTQAVNKKRLKLDSITKLIKTKNTDIDNLKDLIKNLDDKIVRLKEDYSCLTDDNPEEYLINKINDLNAEVKSIDEQINTVTKLITPNNEKLKVAENSNKISQEKIDALLADEDYILFQKFISTNPKEGKLKETDLDLHLTKINDEVKEKHNNHVNRISLIKELENKLSKFEVGAVNEELESLALKIQKNNNEIQFFRKEASELLGVLIDSLSQKDLISKINSFKNQESKKLDKNKEKDVLQNRIAGYKENVQPFLKYSKAKEKSLLLKKKKDYLSNKIESQLKSERSNLEDHIKNHIDSFFYQKLINTLYKKIDPHPDYKEISFKCEFPNGANEKPKLNVFVKDKNGNKHIPSLYFSAAQQNILCLSIFLAKALHATDEKGEPINCIFIDDPVQSMDSINVLSTIDLFRSIVVHLDKQIILSTHDENFQNLLKKKIPVGLFNAKYIELESFGKVKSEIN